MSVNFQSYLIRFMTDLINVLANQRIENQVGESTISKETSSQVFLRLLGLTATASQQEDPESLINNFFKNQTAATENQLLEINRLLKAVKKRMDRYSKVRTSIKLNRIKRIAQTPTKPLEAGDLVKNTPEETRIEVASQLNKLQQANDIQGLVDQEINLNEAMITSINTAAQLPENVGALQSSLLDLLRMNSKDSSDNNEKLQRYKKEITSEIYRLENEENLLFKGQILFSDPNSTLSVSKVLDVLIFLTDRKQVTYKCTQCKYYQKGESGRQDACIFVGEGQSANTDPITTLNSQKQSVKGVVTQGSYSCKDVWSLETNENYRPSDKLIEDVETILE